MNLSLIHRLSFAGDYIRGVASTSQRRVTLVCGAKADGARKTKKQHLLWPIWYHHAKKPIPPHVSLTPAFQHVEELCNVSSMVAVVGAAYVLAYDLAAKREMLCSAAGFSATSALLYCCRFRIQQFLDEEHGCVARPIHGGHTNVSGRLPTR